MSSKIRKNERITERSRHLQSGKQLKGGDIRRGDERYAEKAKAHMGAGHCTSIWLSGRPFPKESLWTKEHHCCDG